MEGDTSFYLDRNESIKITEKGNLPHWQQNMKIQFVTFRLADTLPLSKRQELTEFKTQYIKQNPLPWNNTVKLYYEKILSGKTESLLDNGYGECLLKNRDVRKQLIDVLEFFEGKLYYTYCYVIMPNHVHILLRLLDENEISKVMQIIKRNSSKLINKILDRKGTVWMSSYFDRIIRNEDHLKKCINYIRSNPRNIPSGEYELYFNPNLWI